jgi:hypothetical protein
MNTVSQKFESLALVESEYFRAILDVMYHTKKEDGRSFLSMMNNIVDYTLNIDIENNAINYQIIHIPNCPDWARELLIRFTIHKVALSLNMTTRKMFSQYNIKNQNVILKDDKESVNEYKEIQKKKKYFREVLKSFSKIELPQDNKKSLIIIKEQDLKSSKTDKNPWIHEFFSEKINDDNHNLILSTATTAFDLEKMIREFESQNIPAVENIFIFHSHNKSKVTNSYNKNQLERLNKYGCGIKNCIVFSFSEKPFRLYHTIDNVKYQLTSSLLNKTINKYDDFDGFITFTQEETNYLFNQDVNQETYLVDCPERIFFTSEMDQLIEQFSHNLRYKNNLALSFTENSQSDIIQSIIEEIKDFPIGVFDDFFNLNKQLWLNKIKNVIEAFINDSPTVGFILPKGITNNIKLSLSRLFQKQNRAIKYYSIEDIKNGVKAEKLIVLQYRYTEKFYKSYPNSFDPLPLKDNQKALVIINLLTHNNYYEWNHHWYDRDIHKLLFSNFRKDKLDWKKKSFQRPTLPDIRDYMQEAETDARSYLTEKCKVYYSDGSRPKEYLACERIIYKENGSFRIAELKDKAGTENLSAQILDELVEQVKDLISKRTEDKTKTEALLRSDPKYNLSEIEINSSIELWKILLERKIDKIGVQTVYDEMFSIMSENERILFNTFKNQWCNANNTMILPRSRKHQKALLAYLGFDLGSAYHRIIIAKKLFNINDSRSLNSQIETLLQRTLINTIDEDKFTALSELHSDIFTLLSINNIDDLNALIGLLDISLKSIRIEYDKD